MPAERGSAVFTEMVEHHGVTLIDLRRAVDAVTDDGMVDPNEDRLLDNMFLLVFETYRELPCRASQADDAFRVIGAVAGAGRMTKHAFAACREAAADVRGAA